MGTDVFVFEVGAQRPNYLCSAVVIDMSNLSCLPEIILVIQKLFISPHDVFNDQYLHIKTTFQSAEL